jgi:hypothetical protein
MNSTLRNQLLPKCQPTYAGYLAWRGVARVDELSGEVQHLLAGKTSMYKVRMAGDTTVLAVGRASIWLC